MGKYARFPNKYPNRCGECGEHLEVGDVVFGTKNERGRWEIICTACHETYREEEKKFKGAELSEVVEIGDNEDAISKAMAAVIAKAAADMDKGFFGKAQGKMVKLEFDDSELKELKPPAPVKPKPKPVGALELFSDNADWA